MASTTTTAYPPNGTFWDTLSTSFVDVPVGPAPASEISTTEFLHAAESLTTLFDVLGSIAFTPVKSDLLGNINKIRTYQHSSPATTSTLQSLVRSELATKKHVATEGLLWLTRGLDFTAQALRHNQVHAADELSNSFRAAYGETLKPHHSFLVKPIFSAAMSACPYRKDFYAKLGAEGKEDEVKTRLQEWLTALEQQVTILKAFMAKDGKW